MNGTAVIDGKKVMAGMLPALDSVDIQVFLLGILGEGVGSMSMDTLNAAMSGDISAALSFAKAAKGIDAKELKEHMKTVFLQCFIDGERCDSIDKAFTGKPLFMWKVFFHALKVNFSDFMDAVPLASKEKTTE